MYRSNHKQGEHNFQLQSKQMEQNHNRSLKNHNDANKTEHDESKYIVELKEKLRNLAALSKEIQILNNIFRLHHDMNTQTFHEL